MTKLTYSFEERQAFDIADGAADFAQNEIDIVIAFADESLDGIGDVRDHLDGGTEIVAAPFLGDDVLIDATGRDIVLLVRRHAGEAFIMSKIKIGFRAVVGHINFAVLVGRHRAGVDIEIGVELAQADGISACLKQCTECCGSKAFTERRDHAASDENIPRHGS